MSDPLHKPDLEESINVTETHGRIARQIAAAARENKLAETGHQPIGLWLIAVLVIVGIAAGSVFSTGGKFFSYESTFRPGYRREPSPDDAGGKAVPVEAMVAYKKKGQKIFEAVCQSCHGADAKGGGNYPPLSGSEWVKGPTERFAMIVLNGLHGPTSSGATFGSAGMPAQGAGLSPEDLAGILTFLRNDKGNAVGDIVTVDMAKAAITASGKRANAGKQVDAQELKADHEKMLSGDKLDPTTLVDPITLAPAAAK